MVDNLAEKVDGCPLNRGSWVNCPLYGVAGCRLFRGCLSIGVNGRTVGTFRSVRYIVDIRCWGVSVKRGSTVVRKHTQSPFLHHHVELTKTVVCELTGSFLQKLVCYHSCEWRECVRCMGEHVRLWMCGCGLGQAFFYSRFYIHHIPAIWCSKHKNVIK